MTINIRNLDNVISQFENIQIRLKAETQIALDDSAKGIKEEIVHAIENTQPYQAIDTGKMLSAVVYEIPSSYSRVIKVDKDVAPYAIDMELGSQAHFVPIADLKAWAGRKLGRESLAYAVQKTIARKGVTGRYFFRDASYKFSDIVSKNFLTLLKRII